MKSSGHRKPILRAATERGAFAVLLVMGLLACFACASTGSQERVEAVAPPGAAAALQQVQRWNATLLDTAERSQELGQSGREAAIRPVALEVFDVPSIARASLGRAFDTLAPEEQARWIQVYTEFHIAAAAHNWRTDRGARFEYLGEESAPRGALRVNTFLDRTGNGVDVRRDYLLVQGRDGRWRIIDVYSPRAVSTVDMQRAEYQAVLSRDGFDGLMQSMEQRIASRRSD